MSIRLFTTVKCIWGIPLFKTPISYRKNIRWNTDRRIKPKGGLYYILRVHPLLCGPVRLEMTIQIESNHKLLSMSRQTSSRDTERQLCGGTASSVCGPVAAAAVWAESAGGLLRSHSEELTIWKSTWDSSPAPKTGGEWMGESAETLARSCRWSWSEPVVWRLTLLHNPHRLCRVSVKLCSRSVRSCSSRSFWFLCREKDSWVPSLPQLK